MLNFTGRGLSSRCLICTELAHPFIAVQTSPLEIIAKELVGVKLLKGVSGKVGGYRLSREPEDYSVGEILDVMENSMAVVSCLESGAEECPRAAECDTLPMWTELNQLIHDFLYSKKLSDLI